MPDPETIDVSELSPSHLLILLAWEAGEVSIGRAAELLQPHAQPGIHFVEARDMLQRAIKAGTALALRERREVRVLTYPTKSLSTGGD